MRHIQARTPGGPEVLEITTGAVPEPKPHEVLIRVEAAGVNRPDLMQREGRYPPPADASPLIGLEVAGEVVAAGAEVVVWRPGDRVVALTNGGGYAEYCLAPAVQCLPWPTGFDALKAAALPETYFTVWANLFQHGRLARGESVLVHGGTQKVSTQVVPPWQVDVPLPAHALGFTLHTPRFRSHWKPVGQGLVAEQRDLPVSAKLVNDCFGRKRTVYGAT